MVATIIGVAQTIAFVATFFIMRNTGIRQLRAYVSVTPLDLMELKVGRIPSAQFIIENKGQTLAFNVGYLATISVLRHPLVDNQGDLVRSDGKQTRPDQTLHIGGHIDGEALDTVPLSAEDYARAMGGEDYRLYVCGIVHYRDTFRIDRKTKFCAFVEATELQRALVQKKMASHTGKAKIAWSFSHVHNEAT